MQMVNEAARSGNENVGTGAQGCLLGLEVQATYNNANDGQPNNSQTTSRSVNYPWKCPKLGHSPTARHTVMLLY